MNERILRLNDIIKIQSSSGNFDYDEYQLGMANGLMLELLNEKIS